MAYEEEGNFQFLSSFQVEFRHVTRLVCTYIFLNGCLVFLHKFLYLTGKAVPLGLQLFVQSQPVFIHLRFQFVLQGHKVLLVLPSHALVTGHLLPQLRVLLVFLHLSCYLKEARGGTQGSEGTVKRKKNETFKKNEMNVEHFKNRK